MLPTRTDLVVGVTREQYFDRLRSLINNNINTLSTFNLTQEAHILFDHFPGWFVCLVEGLQCA